MYEGYVFLCNKTSQQECLSKKQYTCMDKENKPTEPIKEGAVIFLHNVEENTLLGPFTALTEGADKLDAGTWRMDVESHIPSEDIKVTWANLRILENADKELPFLAETKTCKLRITQTQQILDVLKKGKLYPYAKQEIKS
ncbi:MAG: hypothetical protein GX799_10810 [Crenarchaeota archaeon]|nr:hypothetical protein [Thermoproteota archaeon]